MKPAKVVRKRRPDRSRDPEESRRALLDAAARLFNSVGYHGTDSNRIARAAGYSAGTFYAHFPDKLAIFLAVYDGWVAAELSAMSQTLQSEGSAQTRRSRLAATILEHHRKWRVFRASLRALYATDPVVRKARLAQRQRQIETLAASFRERGRPVPNRAALLARLLTFEVMCDAVADGDCDRLGIPESDILNLLVESLRHPAA